MLRANRSSGVQDMPFERRSDHNDLDLLNKLIKWNNKRYIDVVFSRNAIDYEVEHIHNISDSLPQLVITFMMIMMTILTFGTKKPYLSLFHGPALE